MGTPSFVASRQLAVDAVGHLGMAAVVSAKRPRFSWVYYRHGAQRGPLVYFKRPGIMRAQGRRRGIVIYWLGWL